MDWKHTVPDRERGFIPAAWAVYEVGQAIVERLDFIAEALSRMTDASTET